MPAGRLVDRARSPSRGQVPAGGLVERARSPSGGQVPAGRLVDPSLRGRKGARKGTWLPLAQSRDSVKRCLRPLA